MRTENGYVIFKSSSPYFEREQSGAKPNTVRVVDVSEVVDIARCDRIRVWNEDESESVGGLIADVSDITEVVAEIADGAKPIVTGRKRVLCISWGAS